MLTFGSHQRWAFGNLRLFDIGDCAGNSRKLGAAELAETIQCRDVEIALDTRFGSSTIKEGRRLRCHRFADQIEDRAQFLIMEGAVGHDQFTRIHPHHIGKKPVWCGFCHAESSG